MLFICLVFQIHKMHFHADDEHWLERHRVQQDPEESAMRDSGWLEGHRIYSTPHAEDVPQVGKKIHQLPDIQELVNDQSYEYIPLHKEKNDVQLHQEQMVLPSMHHQASVIPSKATYEDDIQHHSDVKPFNSEDIIKWISQHLVRFCFPNLGMIACILSTLLFISLALYTMSCILFRSHIHLMMPQSLTILKLLVPLQRAWITHRI